jgi:flagellar protein FliS
MAYSSMTSQYLEAEILSRPKEWLVCLVYEHLISSLTRARVQIENGDIEGKATSLQKASDIVFELLMSLDRSAGGELAENLASLYTFLAGEILAVGRSLDTIHLQRLIVIATELHGAWVQAAEQVAPRGKGAGRSLAMQA